MRPPHGPPLPLGRQLRGIAKLEALPPISAIHIARVRVHYRYVRGHWRRVCDLEDER